MGGLRDSQLHPLRPPLGGPIALPNSQIRLIRPPGTLRRPQAHDPQASGRPLAGHGRGRRAMQIAALRSPPNRGLSNCR